jgi:hypothetical protein
MRRAAMATPKSRFPIAIITDIPKMADQTGPAAAQLLPIRLRRIISRRLRSKLHHPSKCHYVRQGSVGGHHLARTGRRLRILQHPITSPPKT